MGVAPSMDKVLGAMDDQQLEALVGEVYRLDPQRVDAIFAAARERAASSTSSRRCLWLR